MARVPRPIPGRDLKSLPIGPTEAFVLSRVDGIAGEREIAAQTGLSTDTVAGILERLASLGAVGFSSGGSGPRASVAPFAPSPDGDEEAPMGLLPLELGPEFDADLQEDVDIEPERRRRILDIYRRLEHVTFYELLGVPETADKKRIKNAYYALASDYHPDRYFRKQLGSYRMKMEAIFKRLTRAHDVLTSKEDRAEYDAYLAQARQNRAVSVLLNPTDDDVAMVEAAIRESAAGLLRAQMAAQPAASDAALRPSSPPAGGTGPPPPEAPPISAAERRATLARRLLGSNAAAAAARARVSTIPPPSQAQGTVAPAQKGPDAARAAAETLKARYDAAVVAARRQQIERFKDAARTALEKNDYAAAANAYRIATTLDPDDAELARQSEETQKAAAVALAEGYLKQAEYEVSQERWAEAAASFAKVCRGRPDDARIHERVAFTTLKSGGNVRRAVEFARKAVELSPKTPEFRLTLARAYEAAGLDVSAMGELERASEVAPKEGKIREVIIQTIEELQKKIEEKKKERVAGGGVKKEKAGESELPKEDDPASSKTGSKR